MKARNNYSCRLTGDMPLLQAPTADNTSFTPQQQQQQQHRAVDLFIRRLSPSALACITVFSPLCRQVGPDRAGFIFASVARRNRQRCRSDIELGHIL